MTANNLVLPRKLDNLKKQPVHILVQLSCSANAPRSFNRIVVQRIASLEIRTKGMHALRESC